MDDTKKRIRGYIEENFLFGGDRQMEDDTSLLEAGLIDSTGILEIVAYLEEQFGVKVADEELTPDNFDSVASITAYVERKQAQAA